MLAELSLDIFQTNTDFSVTYNFLDWCLMLPMEQPLGSYNFYAIAFEKKIILAMLGFLFVFSMLLEITSCRRFSPRNIILNIYVFNGLLGQPFPMQPNPLTIQMFLYSLIFLQGLIFNTAFVTQLQTLKATPTTEKAIRTVADMEKANLKFGIVQDEVDILKSQGIFDEFQSVSQIMEPLEFFRRRDGFDSRYAYSVPFDRWVIYEEQQRYFQMPKFRISNICLVKTMGMAIPLQANSPYKNAIDTMIGRLSNGGIINYWKSMAFWEACILIDYILIKQNIQKSNQFNKKSEPDELLESPESSVKMSSALNVTLLLTFVQLSTFEMALSGTEAKDEQLLKFLWQQMKRISVSKFLLIAKQQERNDYIRKILQFSVENKALNTMVVKESFVELREIFLPQIYPKFKMKRMVIENMAGFEFYPDPVKNMHQYQLQVAIVNASYRAYISKMFENHVHLSGYLGSIFTEFARKHNATIKKLNMTLGHEHYYLNKDIHNIIEDESYEMLAEISVDIFKLNIDFSTMYDFLDWCLMVPMEQPLNSYEYYIITFDKQILILILCSLISLSVLLGMTSNIKRVKSLTFPDLFFNIYVFNGLLGQSFKTEPTPATIPFVTHLQTFKATPTLQKPILTLDDMRKANLKFALINAEENLIRTQHLLSGYETACKIMESEEFYHRRNAFDTRYAYAVPSDRWNMYKEQQRYFLQPKFRMSDICFVKMIRITIPLQLNSPYKNAIDAMIRRLTDVALSGTEAKDEQLLKFLWQQMKRISVSKFLLIAKQQERNDYIRKILQFSVENKALNTMVVKESFVELREIFLPQIYPKFKMKRMVIENMAGFEFYPDPVKNMHQYQLQVAIVNASYRAYISKMFENHVHLSGYLGSIFTEFARKHNATIKKLNMTLGHEHYYLNKDIHNIIEDESYEMLAEISVDIFKLNIDFSTMYDFLDWCLMVPMEQPLEAYEYYILTFENKILVVMLILLFLLSVLLGITSSSRGMEFSISNLFVNINVFNGLLGQSFKMEPTPTTIPFVTYLQTLKATPTLKNPILTLDDMREANLKFALIKEEEDLIKTQYLLSGYETVCQSMEADEFYHRRNGFDTQYAYTVPSDRWNVYKEQQRYFLKPKFRMTGICFAKMVGVTIPLQLNSPYKNAIDAMIGRLNEGGIIEYWKSLAFWEAVKKKEMSLIDTSQRFTFVPMKLEDMRLLWLLFGYMLSLME
uniref:Ionotropic glutamate receptor C-terminal domain-containing protein n=1 Tax=Musca domestica TaxID=7370 RepID=A0A1I8NEM1_MUSDO